MADAILSEDVIDLMTFPEAFRTCRIHRIKIGDIKDLCTLTWLIKYHLLCRDRCRSEELSFFALNTDHERTRKEALASLYDDTNASTQKFALDDRFFAEFFPSMRKELDEQMQKIASEKSPILILGETGSGKTSFINLLLGKDFLPTSILSNTRVICEIRYGEKSSARLYAAGATRNPKIEFSEEVDGSSFTAKLGEHLQKLDENGKAVYRLAEIYLPCAILKPGLLIVDSPGIGESEEMNSMVLDYILNACAFIYIINSTNAGGIQMRVKALVREVYKKVLDKQKEYRPDNAIFICNKWDEINKRDRNDVWNDTKAKLKKAWPTCKESQIIKFSTKEALFIQQKGAVSPAFQIVLQSISELLPVSHEVQLLKGYMYLEESVTRCVHFLGTNLEQTYMTREQRTTKLTESTARLNQIKSKLTDFLDRQRKSIKDEVDNIADQLKEFIDKKSNTENVCKFSECELPRKKTWNDVRVEIRSVVYHKLRNAIKEWETGEATIGGMAKQIECTLEEEFPALSKEIFYAEQIMSSSEKDQGTHSVVQEDDVRFVPEFVTKGFSRLSTGFKIGFGILLSPVFAVGVIGRIPIYGGMLLNQYRKNTRMARKFREAENDNEKLKELCESYARITLTKMTESMNLREVVNEDIKPLLNYINQQQKRMDDQIQSDLDLLTRMQNDERTDEDIRKIYEPMKSKYQLLQQRLELFLLTHLSGCLFKEIPVTAIEMRHTKICEGISATVFSAKSRAPSITENNTDICLRSSKEKITVDNSHRFRAVQIAYTTLRQDNIAICYGTWNQDLDLGRLCQVLEPIKCSLRDYLTATDFNAYRENNCVRTMIEIVSALDFLHNRKFVHFDLSMDTVAVNFNGSVKLTNISREMPVNIQPELTNGKVCMSNYIHLPPKFFLNENNPIYGARDDMYSVGIMMWEMWTGQGVVELGKLYDIDQVLKEEMNAPVLLKSSENAPLTSRVTTTDSFDNSKSAAAGCRQQSRSSLLKKGFSDSLENDDDDEDDASKSSEDHTTTDSDEIRGSSSYEVSEDPELFRNLIVAFRPKYLALQFEFKDNEKKHAFGQQWWNTVQNCLDEKCSAEDWLNCWREHPLHVAQDRFQ